MQEQTITALQTKLGMSFRSGQVTYVTRVDVKFGHIRRILDYCIVASFLCFPHSFFMNYPTSLFPSLRFQQVLLLSLPAMLIALKRIITPPFWNKLLLHKTLKYFVFVSYGLVPVLFYTQRPLLEGAQNYFVMLYWMILVLLYLGLSREQPIYHIELIRLFFVHVAILGIVFYVSYGLVGITHILFYTYAWGEVRAIVPFLGLSLYYSNSPWFSNLVPRYTFFFQEPRILGIRMPMTLFLQIGNIKYHRLIWNKKNRLFSKIILATVFTTMFIIHTVWGYISLILAIFVLFWERVFKVRVKSFTLLMMSSVCVYFCLGLIIILAFFEPKTSGYAIERFVQEHSAGVVAFLEATEGKIPEVLENSIVQTMSYMLNLYYFPFGSGLLVRDGDFYYRQYWINVGGGLGIIHNMIIHAGIIGIFSFIYILRRIGLAMKGVQRTGNKYLKYFLTMVNYTFLTSIFIDMFYFSATLFLYLFLIELIIIDFTSTRQPLGTRNVP